MFGFGNNADTITARLERLGLQLPEVAAPVAAYIPANYVWVEPGTRIITSGQLPVVNGKLLYQGKVGLNPGNVTPEDAVRAAQQCALNALAAAASLQKGDVNKLDRVVKVTVFVASDPEFTSQAQVADGVSNLYAQLFGSGHARSAVGVAVLPLNSPVEVEVEFLSSFCCTLP